MRSDEYWLERQFSNKLQRPSRTYAYVYAFVRDAFKLSCLYFRWLAHASSSGNGGLSDIFPNVVESAGPSFQLSSQCIISEGASLYSRRTTRSSFVSDQLALISVSHPIDSHTSTSSRCNQELIWVSVPSSADIAGATTCFWPSSWPWVTSGKQARLRLSPR